MSILLKNNIFKNCYWWKYVSYVNTTWVVRCETWHYRRLCNWRFQRASSLALVCISNLALCSTSLLARLFIVHYKIQPLTATNNDKLETTVHCSLVLLVFETILNVYYAKEVYWFFLSDFIYNIHLLYYKFNAITDSNNLIKNSEKNVIRLLEIKITTV